MEVQTTLVPYHFMIQTPSSEQWYTFKDVFHAIKNCLPLLLLISHE